MTKTYKNEQGRSMVEMLGVLAVIGVLSVAGIAGYSMAMRNYRANEIVNAASMFYVLAKAQNQGNGPTENITYENVGGTNPSGATLTYTNNAFTITFDDPNDCTMAANKLGDKATADCTNKKLTVNFGESTTTPTDTPSVENTYENFIDKKCTDADFAGCYAYDSNTAKYRLMKCDATFLSLYDDDYCNEEECGGCDCTQYFNVPACNTIQEF